MRLCIDYCCARLKVNRNGFESIGNGELVECGMMGGWFLHRYNNGMTTKRHGQKSKVGLVILKFNERDFIECQASEIADKLSQTWGICEMGEVSNFNRVIWISEKINECICYSNYSYYQNCVV